MILRPCDKCPPPNAKTARLARSNIPIRFLQQEHICPRTVDMSHCAHPDAHVCFQNDVTPRMSSLKEVAQPLLSVPTIFEGKPTDGAQQITIRHAIRQDIKEVMNAPLRTLDRLGIALKSNRLSHRGERTDHSPDFAHA